MTDAEQGRVAVYLGDELAAYGFGQEHPFGPDRHDAFKREFLRRGLDARVVQESPVRASDQQILRFHTEDYLAKVKQLSQTGRGYLDAGDTPAFSGVYEAAATVVGTACKALDDIMQGRVRRGFVPIAGLHHARRHTAAGFCVFNDCGVVIETLLQEYGLERVCYVDIDAHHGDGVFYDFEGDPRVIFLDVHEDGRYLYPGTGAREETGKGQAKGCKLNIPMPPDAGDELFHKIWPQAQRFIADHQPQFIVLQCGADSVAGDPITHLRYTSQVHGFTAKSLCQLADEYCNGRLLALGGGGYNRENLAMAWCEVVAALSDIAE